ncbi:LacI family DNA-binding transcriptional regulator [Klenkia taihuensis]|uniref:LacI family DNA-binding transcriptional regulator n=1 Tax=Klenkia taihuensis TaxID=1225127 RepID=UPI001A95D25F|nr:LacI family DNA-binding transcriptional regulator [Klenkia taihuensis]
MARLAGVSRQTVSRVCNASGPVAAATRVRVLEAVAALAYEPDTAAQELGARSSARQRSGTARPREQGVHDVDRTLADACAGAPLLVIPTTCTPEQRSHLEAMAARMGIPSVLV